MCLQASSHDEPDTQPPGSKEPSDDFPWDVGVADAHCHLTDTMTAIASLDRMRARVLTIMATRLQDQDLVASVTAGHGMRDREGFSSNVPSCRLVPSFGWHPWFSHQLYDDIAPAEQRTYDPRRQGPEEKSRHYKALLAPPPSDEAFISAQPEPLSLLEFIEETRQRLLAHPLALVGEIGLDKAFRLPQPWTDTTHSTRDEALTPGGREGRMLAAQRVKMEHQVRVLRCQLDLAAELGRAVSVHGVQAHGAVFETLSGTWKGHEREVISKRQQKKEVPGAETPTSPDGDDRVKGEAGPGPASPPKPYPPRICLHSFSGPDQVLRQYLNPAIPAKVFFSFSTCVNFSTPASRQKTPGAIRACPDDRILVESDLHTAGEQMDYMLEDMYRRVCEIKDWPLREGVQRIRRNYEEFIFG